MNQLVGVGVYDAREVSFLLGAPSETIIRWSNPDKDGSPAMVQPYLASYFNFEDLVSFSVAFHIRRNGISEKNMRNGIEFLRQDWNSLRPLANQSIIENIATSGSSFLTKRGNDWIDIGRGGQGTFRSAVRIYLKNISFNQSGMASRWFASTGVVLDPTIQAGTPCIEGTRIPTSTILSLLRDESVEEVASDLELDRGQVEAARNFELSLAAGNGLRAA
jgi:uncharacterized protein (DUF433 family)